MTKPDMGIRRGSATNRWFVVGVDVFFVLALTVVYQRGMFLFNLGSKGNNWGLFEVLVNYEAGFIRRGLLGQALYWTASLLHVDVMALVVAVVVPAFVFVAVFMLRKFRHYGIRWWLLFVIGSEMMTSVIRKDFIIYALFIALLYIYRSRLSVTVRIAAMSAVSVAMLLTYETSMFMCLGFTALLVLRDKSLPKAARLTYPCILCVTMLALLSSTGAAGAGQAIYDSWLRIYPGGFAVSDFIKASLDWTVGDSLRYNWHALMPRFSAITLFRYLFLIVVTSYLYISYMYVCTFRSDRRFPCPPTTFTTLYLFFMVCMLPLWAGLSCDWGRMLYHATLSALCVALILPQRVTIAAFPAWALRAGGALARLFGRIPCSVYSVTILILVITPAYTFVFTPEYDLGTFKIDSMLGRVVVCTREFLDIIVSHIPH